jgi:protein O-GlcNAc transferase
MLQSIDVAEESKLLRRQGNALLRVNQPSAALACFDRALGLCPGDALTHNDRGNALQDMQQLDSALTSYNRALSLQPQFPAALTNRSNALRAMRRLDDALRDLDPALGIRPAFPEALNNRGNVLRDMRRLREALASFDAALALKPELVMAHCNRGNTLLDLDRPREALASFDAALERAPDDGEALFGRAVTLLKMRQALEQAVDCFDRAASFGIDRVETLVGKAAALSQLQRHTQAAACLSEVLSDGAASSERAYVRGSLVYSRLQTLDWSDYSSLVGSLERRVSAGLKVTYPLSLLPVTDSPELTLACARILVGDLHPAGESLGPQPIRRNRPAAGRRIRVAYVSADFRDHPVSHLLVGVLERHDKQQFETLGVSLRAGDGGELSQRITAAFDRMIDATVLSDRETAELLRELEVDIAVDLMGFTDGARPGIFAHRAAPVQVNYLGYAGTLGAEYMDYVLADEVVIPPGQERWYAERVIRLPHCYLPNDDKRAIGPAPSREQAGLPAQGMVFCAFTNAYKINPPVFDIWMRLLREVPQSVLWLRGMGAEARTNVLREAAQRGVEAPRLVFAPHVASMADHLARHQLADLYLDTLPYNAHSTTCDALWAGVPVITCVGRTFASRVAASALTAVGLPELITQSLQEYEERALQLAREPERLTELRQRLARQRLGAQPVGGQPLAARREQSPLFDTQTYCQHLESAFRGMLVRSTHIPATHAASVHSSLGSDSV